MFSALRQGTAVYVLDKTEEPKVKIGYVESVTQPRPMYKTYDPTVSFGTNMQTVVDLSVKFGNEKKDFVGLPSTSTIHAFGDYVVSETREAMISEVDAMLQRSKDILDSIDNHKKIIASCESILKELNPVYAREQERDSAIVDLTNKVNTMSDEFTSIKDSLSMIQNILSKSNN